METWMLANLGEICAWLVEDEGAAERYAAWYNACSARFGMDKPQVTGALVQLTCREMFSQLALDVAVQS